MKTGNCGILMHIVAYIRRVAQRIRIDRVSGANHDLIRLLNKPGHDGMRTIL
jgi:hypothetical protein